MKRNVTSVVDILEEQSMADFRSLEVANPLLAAVKPNFNFIKVSKADATFVKSEAKEKAFNRLYEVICVIINKINELDPQVSDIFSYLY